MDAEIQTSACGHGPYSARRIPAGAWLGGRANTASPALPPSQRSHLAVIAAGRQPVTLLDAPTSRTRTIPSISPRVRRPVGGGVCPNLQADQATRRRAPHRPGLEPLINLQIRTVPDRQHPPAAADGGACTGRIGALRARPDAELMNVPALAGAAVKATILTRFSPFSRLMPNRAPHHVGMDPIRHSGSRWEPGAGDTPISTPPASPTRQDPHVVVIAAVLVAAGLLGAAAGTTLARDPAGISTEQRGGNR